jgi:hypothetical protein
MPLNYGKSKAARQQNIETEIAAGKPPKQAVALSLAYIAGFVDGEGCIGTTRSGQHRLLIPRIMVVNTDRRVLDALQRQFGGDVAARKQQIAGWKPLIQWRICNGNALVFLRAIRPFLVLKADQADVLLRWPTSARFPKTRDAVKLRRELLASQLTYLNRKGTERAA